MIRFLALLFFFSPVSLSVGNDEKVYTENEFQKKLYEELEKLAKTIKRKSVRELSNDLIKKKKELSLREIDLNKRAEALEKSEKELSKKLVSFQKKQNRLIGCIKENKDEEMGRIKKLVEVVSNMKADKAAQLISVQDPDISIKILSLLDTVKASKIFNVMDKEKSAQLQKQYLNMKR
jgi:flagellar motility protein MotE (MotC chaperone)